MKLCIVIPSWSYERFRSAVGSFLARAIEPERLSFVFVGPASEEEGIRDLIGRPAGVIEVLTKMRVGPIDAMNRGGVRALDTGAEIIGFIHDDVEMIEVGWDERISLVFQHTPRCGLLGFGGATGLADEDIYRTPYRLIQLARHDYRSNMRDWQIHGKRAEVPMRVAVLDAFSQIFTRDAYTAMGTWKAALDLGLYHHMIDAFAACMMRRLGYEVWLAPIHAHHSGGITSTSALYDSDLRAKGIAGDSEIHERAHKLIFEHFRDVLPIRV